MPRRYSVKRKLGSDKVYVCLDTIEHTLTEQGFIEFMEQALNVLQAIVAARTREGS